LLNIASDLQGWTTDFCPFETASDDEIYNAIQPNTKVILLSSHRVSGLVDADQYASFLCSSSFSRRRPTL
jgi:hypothetical protein